VVGADIISAGGGNDTVTIHGSEASVDGGAGSDTLILTTGTSVSTVDFGVLAGSDQTGGDSITVTNFENLLASAVTTALSGRAHRPPTSSRRALATTHRQRRRRRHHRCGNRKRQRILSRYRGFDRRRRRNGYAGPQIVRRHLSTVDLSGAAGSDQTFGDSVAVSNFENVDASVLLAARVSPSSAPRAPIPSPAAPVPM